jgi:katanin p80 WD40 repeat-containing subunit B1
MFCFTAVIRTLTGHKATIRCLDIHPYGDFVVSGSADTLVKVWDVRRKGCIFTYKGHTDCVNCLRVSPDGRWVVSCSDDGTIRLWDLTAGKQYHCFKDFDGPVEWLEFHPAEFLLTACGADRTIKFWDLETLQCISSTEPESSSVQCIKFHPDGSPLFSGGQDSLRVYGWEPTCCFDAVAISWGRVVDMSIVNNQLVTASLYQTLVSVWVTDLMRLKPFISSSDNCSEDNAAQRVLSGRKSFVRDIPASPQRSPIPKDVVTENNENAAPVTDEDKEEIFKSRHTLLKTPPKKFDPFPAPPEDAPDPPMSVMIHKQPPARPKTTSTSSKSARAASDVSKVRQKEETKADIVSHDREKPVGLDAEEFLQKNRMQNPPTVGLTINEAVKKLEAGHHAMSSVLSLRATQLGLVRAAWSTDNVKSAVCVALDQGNDSVIIDMLQILCLKHSLWNLEICNLLLPKLQQLLFAKYGSYVLMACRAIKLILRNFAPVIKSNLASPPGPGIDISREERLVTELQCTSMCDGLNFLC